MKVYKLLSVLTLSLLGPTSLSAQQFLPNTIGSDAQIIFRDNPLIGVPSSGTYQPKKSDMRTWGTVIGAALGDPQYITASNLDLTGATDASVGLQALINAYPTRRIYIPAGTPLLLNPIVLHNGQILECEGRTQTVFQVNASFSNMAAKGIISLGSSEPGAQVMDCGINFYQPSVLTRSTVIQYPPALYAKNMPRFIIDRVRVSNAWECLDATGNSGGARIGMFECGAFATASATLGGAIAFDGSLDFVHVGSVECWPFGVNASGIAVYTDLTGACWSEGYVDGMSIDKLATYTTGINFTANASNSLSAAVITNLQADTDGSLLNVAGGWVQIGKWYASRNTSGPAATITGGSVFVDNIDYFSAYRGAPGISVSGGSLTINGGNFLQFEYANPIAQVTGGTLSISNTYPTYASPRSGPLFNQTGGVLILQNNHSAGPNGSTANIFSVAADNLGNYIAGNDFPGWKHTVPATAVGFYDLNEPDVITATPSFATNGDFVPTITQTAGSLWRKGNFTEFMVDATFNTNAYTTAAGAFSLNVNAPVPLETYGECVNGKYSNIVAGATTYWPEKQGTAIFWRSWVGGNIGPAQIPPNTTGVEMRFSCRYRVR